MADPASEPANSSRSRPPQSRASRLVRKILFYAIVVAIALFILGSIGSALQAIYVKMSHPSRPEDQTDQAQ